MEDTGLQDWPSVVSAVPLFLPPTSKVFHLLPNTLLPLVFMDYLLPLLFLLPPPRAAPPLDSSPGFHYSWFGVACAPFFLHPVHPFPPCTPWPPFLLFLSIQSYFYSASTHTGLRLPPRFFCSFLFCPLFVFTSTETVPPFPPIFRLPSLHFTTSYDKRTLDGTL